MRRLAVLIAIAALATAAWFVYGSNVSELAPAGEGEESSSAEIQSKAAAGVDASGSSQEGARPRHETARSEVQAPKPDSGEQLGMLRILVVNKATGAAVPGAKISYLVNTDYDYQGMSPEEMREYNRLSTDKEQINSRYGTTVQTGEDGSVLVPRKDGQEWFQISARHEQLYGETLSPPLASLPRGEDLELRVELERDLDLLVQVLDSRRQPAVDVPISIRPREVDTSRHFGPSQALTEAPDGVARIPHLQIKQELWQRQGETGTAYLAEAIIPGMEDGGVAFDMEALPEKPIVLLLPPSGKIEIRAGARTPAERAEKLDNATLSEVPANTSREITEWRPSEGRGWFSSFDAERICAFEWVLLGKTFLATAHLGGDFVQKVFSGPTRTGELVKVSLDPPEDSFSLQGRLLSQDQKPMPKARMRARFSTEDGRKYGDVFNTDDQGRFSLHAKADDERVTLASLTITPYSRAGTDEIAFLIYDLPKAIPLNGRSTDLGDLIMGKRLLIASGQVRIDGEIRDASHLDLLVDKWVFADSRRGGKYKWARDLEVKIAHLSDGRFELRGLARAQRYRLFLSQKDRVGMGNRMDFLPTPPVEFAAGAEDLRLDLDTGGSLQASLLLDDSTQWHHTLLELIPSRTAAHAEVMPWPSRMQFPYNERLFAQIAKQPEERVEYVWGALWPGEYRLEIRPRAASEAVFAIENIMITSGETTNDPRLSDIDLRGKMRLLKITVEDHQGERIVAAGRVEPQVVIDDPDPLATMHGFAASNGVAFIYTAEASLDLLVFAKGYQPKKLMAIRESQTVVLDPLPDLEFQLSEGLESLPDSLALKIELKEQGHERDKRGAITDRINAMELDYFLLPRAMQGELDRNGRGTLRVPREGTFAIKLSLMDGASGRALILQSRPAQVTVKVSTTAGQLVNLQIDPSELAQALKSLAKD